MVGHQLSSDISMALRSKVHEFLSAPAWHDIQDRVFVVCVSVLRFCIGGVLESLYIPRTGIL